MRPIPAARAAVAHSFIRIAGAALDRHAAGDLPDAVRREVVGALAQAIAELGGDVTPKGPAEAGEGGEG